MSTTSTLLAGAFRVILHPCFAKRPSISKKQKRTMRLNAQISARLRGAVKQFWGTRETQSQKQGAVSGAKDAGTRSAVTGGAQMNGFINLVRDLLCQSGLPEAQVFCEKYVELPGWYRPEKKWDLLIVADGKLLAGIEFKSQVGS